MLLRRAVSQNCVSRRAVLGKSFSSEKLSGERSAVLQFVDDGYSGSTLARPALERLRDVAAAGGMDRLYLHCWCVRNAGMLIMGSPLMRAMRIIGVVARVRLPRHGGKRWCWNKELRMDQTDAAVWQEVCRLLEDSTRLEQEYRRRLQPHQQPNEYHGLEALMSKLRRGIARLIDSYADGLIDKQKFEPRVTRMRERLQHLEAQLSHLKEAAAVEEELRLILGVWKALPPK